jgi:hypothetical protein
MKRWAFTIAAGPKYWSSAQKTGHEVVQAAQRMHLVVSSKRVEDDDHRQADLEHAHERGPVGADAAVVGLGRDVDQRGVRHVGEQVEQDRDARDAVQDPGPHALASAVERAEALHPRAVTSWGDRSHPTVPSPANR